MSSVDLSFVICVYNTEKYLLDCLRSIECNAKDVSYEIIVVDDCSPGNCEELVRQNEKVKYIRLEKNSAQFRAREAGLLIAKGEFVCFPDADDWYCEADFGGLIREAKESGADAVIFPWIEGLNEGDEGNKIVRDISCTLRGRELFDSLCNSKVRWNLFNKLFRLSSLKNVISFFETNSDYINMCEDFCVFSCFAYDSELVVYTKTKTKYFYRANPDSETRKRKTIQQVLTHLKSYGHARSNVLKYLTSRGADEISKDKIDRLHFWNLTWYYDTFVRNAAYQQRNEIFKNILRSFNFDLSCNYLIENQYGEFCSYLADCKSEYLSQKRINKVAIVVSSLGGGGTERVAVTLGKIFATKNIDVCFITRFYADKEYECSAKRYNVPKTGYERYKEMEQIINENNVDTIVFVDYYKLETMDEIVWARLHGHNVIAMEHNNFFAPSYSNYPVLYSKRERAYRLVDALTCLSEMDLFAWRNVGISNSYFVPNPILRDENQSVVSWDCEPNIIFVARCNEYKGVFKIPEIMSYVCKAIPNALIYVCGQFEGNDKRGYFDELCRKFNVTNNVKFVGQVSDISSYYSKAKIMILPSLFEGFPMVLHEAKRFGIPAVVFSMPYLVGGKNDEGCIQVAYGDTNEMAEWVIKLLTNIPLWTEYSNAAKNSENLTSERLVWNAWDVIFNDLNNRGCNSLLNVETSLKSGARIFFDELYKLEVYKNSIGCDSYVQQSRNESLKDINRRTVKEYARNWIRYVWYCLKYKLSSGKVRDKYYNKKRNVRKVI